MTLEKVPGGKAAIGANIDAMVAATMEAEMAGGGQPTRQSKVAPPPPAEVRSARSTEASKGNNKIDEDAPADSTRSRSFTLQEAGQSMDHALKAKQKLIQAHLIDHEKKLVDQQEQLKKVRQKLDRLEQDQAAEIAQMQKSVDHLSRELAIREKEATQKKAIMEEANKDYLAAAESLDACKREKTETERVLMELLLKAGESRDKVMNEMLHSLDTL
ncbi:hypothetical protein Pmar_PMAR014983 [Perkinsus marinus ATCC 50983]|uniref:RAB6-interacting golgin n=1 Tax=Perkinsus marinus (strain ATCC 50983 / TXsc) TaxID=423536 RepID=C5L3A4_PERM5|nr:hypothetical protein Pmar_PMAR014983 [Perkinsus marinus ATCC 50983]EER08789.1 hypothetical protein Pmar_PMAR014983 [Perkinsus marinus ATCC 50983]|eukprot:XP_002776973.1 hypothetical protein Pmar_PMAR014983 [Perkinsus marinus ATCC 50983]